MKSPITGKEMILSTEKRTIKVDDENIEIDFSFYMCDSGEKFTTTELDEKNINNLNSVRYS